MKFFNKVYQSMQTKRDALLASMLGRLLKGMHRQQRVAVMARAVKGSSVPDQVAVLLNSVSASTFSQLVRAYEEELRSQGGVR
jgi:hypothetical protein